MAARVEVIDSRVIDGVRLCVNKFIIHKLSSRPVRIDFDLKDAQKISGGLDTGISDGAGVGFLIVAFPVAVGREPAIKNKADRIGRRRATDRRCAKLHGGFKGR